MSVVSALPRPVNIVSSVSGRSQNGINARFHQLSAGGGATKGERRRDHPAGGTLVRLSRMASFREGLGGGHSPARRKGQTGTHVTLG
jgi:hypothetical protein